MKDGMTGVSSAHVMRSREGISQGKVYSLYRKNKSTVVSLNVVVSCQIRVRHQNDLEERERSNQERREDVVPGCRKERRIF